MCRRVVLPRIENALAECSTIVHRLYGGFAIHHALCKTDTLKIQEFRIKLVHYLLVQNHYTCIIGILLVFFQELSTVISSSAKVLTFCCKPL